MKMEFLNMKRFFTLAALLPLLLAAGCIQIRHRDADSGTDPVSSPAPRKAAGENEYLPVSSREKQLWNLIRGQIARGRIRWEEISRYPAPEQSWREDRFRLLRPKCTLKESDFLLKKITPLPGGHWLLTCSFLPLRAVYDRKFLWDTSVNFELDQDQEIADIHMYSNLLELDQTGLLRLDSSECNAVSAAVLKTLFQEHLPGSVRASERFRFCFPVNGADEKFLDRLRPRARIPELDPSEEYPDFPIPFEKGRYRSCDNGAFYYYAGIVLPVTSKEVWVFDTAIRYASGQTRGFCYKLKKGLFFWEVMVRAEYDAPSRAVRDKEK